MLCVACTDSAFEAEQQKNVENCNRILKERMVTCPSQTSFLVFPICVPCFKVRILLSDFESPH